MATIPKPSAYTAYGLEFWPERGMITVAILKKAGDSNCTADEAFKRIKPVDFLKRAAAVLLYHRREGTPDSERIKAERFMAAAQKAVKTALQQGDPTDPKVLGHAIKHTSKASILVPESDIPYKIGIRDTPQNTLLEGHTMTPDFNRIITP